MSVCTRPALSHWAADCSTSKSTAAEGLPRGCSGVQCSGARRATAAAHSLTDRPLPRSRVRYTRQSPSWSRPSALRCSVRNALAAVMPRQCRAKLTQPLCRATAAPADLRAHPPRCSAPWLLEPVALPVLACVAVGSGLGDECLWISRPEERSVDPMRYSCRTHRARKAVLATLGKLFETFPSLLMPKFDE